jgi:hypothetical protein
MHSISMYCLTKREESLTQKMPIYLAATTTYFEPLSDLYQCLQPVPIDFSIILDRLLTASYLLAASDPYLIRTGCPLPSLLQSLYVAHSFGPVVLRLLLPFRPRSSSISSNTILLCTQLPCRLLIQIEVDCVLRRRALIVGSRIPSFTKHEVI